MDQGVFESINLAKLTEIKASFNTEEILAWVEEVLKSYSDIISCPKYQSVFLSKDIDQSKKIIGAAGRLLGLKVSVSTTEILGELDYLGEVFFSTTISPASSYATTPFHEVFDLSKSLYGKIKESLSPELYPAPFIGGVRSIILSDQRQEIVNYYLPEIELFGGEDHFELFTAKHIPENIILPKHIAVDAEPSRVGYASITDEPNKDEYLSNMAEILQKLETKYLKKVVYSRKRSITPELNFDRDQYVKFLFRKYYQEYFYLFRQGEEVYWAGISPEVIIKQEGRQAVTEPLAGTRKKTSDTTDYEAVRKELTSTPKDIVEHDYASFFMHDQLVGADIGPVEIINNKTLLETPYAFHIKSQISIDLNPSTSFFDIIRAIYPPPTIWGIPIDKTEKTLEEFEPFDREFYTGLYGYWTFADTANIALVIRTVKVGVDSICLYAGGGIVSSSDPIAEYEEAENKMLPLLDYFLK
ncbi:MAG: chorismate-binding protein [Anaerolineaceae bacterium]|nr:chorismate-binding protein [Anaerolineaceae bacterium]